MNRTIVMLLAGIVVSALLPLVPPAAAQTNIAILDTQYVVQMSEVGKSLRAQAERQRGSDDRLVKSEEDNLVKLEQTLTQQRATISAEEYQKRVQELRKKNADVQRDDQDRQARLEVGYRNAALKIETTIEQIATEIDKERNFVMAIRRSAIAGNTTAPDITQEVLKRLNQRMPNVALELPK